MEPPRSVVHKEDDLAAVLTFISEMAPPRPSNEASVKTTDCRAVLAGTSRPGKFPAGTAAVRG